jgi:hypothetical protein
MPYLGFCLRDEYFPYTGNGKFAYVDEFMGGFYEVSQKGENIYRIEKVIYKHLYREAYPLGTIIRIVEETATMCESYEILECPDADADFALPYDVAVLDDSVILKNNRIEAEIRRLRDTFSGSSLSDLHNKEYEAIYAMVRHI